jgi:hypothetical protein
MSFPPAGKLSLNEFLAIYPKIAGGADNVNVTPGSGVVIATRDAGSGVEVQRVIPNTWSGGVATDISSTNPMPSNSTIKDGVGTALATVAAFHNADNQAPSGFVNGLLTGGVAQLINSSGNLDRARETGVDGVSAIGISTGSAQVGSPFSTTIAANVSTGAQTVTPAAMSGTNRGGAWSIQVGSVLSIANSGGGNSENVIVTAVASTTFTATFALSKTGPGVTVNGFVYNQERDATTGDAATGKGIVTATDYLFNGTTFDAARSASAANVSTQPVIGVDLHTLPGMWSVVHTPATTVQATASKAAGAAGVRHVATGFTATYAAGGTAITAATPLLINLRDGATGAGTVLWSSYINVPGVAAQAYTISMSNLSLVGTAATAMTLEFSAAGGTNSYESVSIQGYDVV